MDTYAVVGNPVEHSKSPLIHAEFAKQTHQEMQYTEILAPLDGFKETILEFKEAGGKGVNVTVPFKEQAYALATESSELASMATAANTLVFNDNGSIFADNTDGAGLVQDLSHNHHYSVRQKKLLLVGAGGAARGVLAPLLCLAPAILVVTNRTAKKAITLAEQFQMKGEIEGVGLDELNGEPYDLIINATSASLEGKVPALPESVIGNHTWCYDMMYADKPTAFMQWAQDLGAKNCLDGLGMLVEQAAVSFYLWRGVYPQTQPVLEMLRTSQKHLSA